MLRNYPEFMILSAMITDIDGFFQYQNIGIMILSSILKNPNKSHKVHGSKQNNLYK